MTGLETLIGALGLSFASGINLYATVLVIGLAQRFEWFSFLPEQLRVLSDPVVLWVAGILYALEFFADKVPFVATVWDGFHTFIRPTGAALLSMGMAEQMGPGAQVAAFLIGGSVALGSHATKAGARAMALTAPEPVTHSLISVAEDVGAIGLTALVFTHPWIAFGVVATLLAVMAFVTPLLFRTLRFLVRSFFGTLGSWFGFEPSAGLAASQPWLERRLEQLRPGSRWEVYRGYVRKAPGLPRFSRAMIAVDASGAVLVRKGWIGTALVELESRSLWRIERRTLCDLLEMQSVRGEDVRVLLTKDWAKAYRERAGVAEPPDGDFAAARA
ncbi:MAG: DUF4126 family protein [Acidobacteria bacterium]|nr:DUF4126 family protein [Acidobacteriota bacterium]